MNKGFLQIHSPKQKRFADSEPFFKVSAGEHEYVENISFQNSKDECLALPYGYFVSAMLAKNTLHIMYNNWEVFIDGRNLKPIYNAILERNLKFIRKAEDNETDDYSSSTYISTLQVKSNEMENLMGQPPKDLAESESDNQQDSKEE